MDSIQEQNDQGQVVQEIIGRVAVQGVSATGLYNQSVDASQPDNAFWDALRYGEKADYKLGGLFAEPIARALVSWVLGKGFIATVDLPDEDVIGQQTNTALAAFIKDNLPLLLENLEDSYALGNSYTVINVEGSLERISPEQVKIICDPPGSKNVIGYEITSVLEKQTITDRYTATERTIITKEGGKESTQKFKNLIGMTPVVHWATKRAANELYGRPIFASLLHLFGRYDRVITKGLNGVELMGQPFPTIEGVDDPQKTLEALSTDSEYFTNSAGQQRLRYKIDFSRIPLLVVGKGGHFKFSSPDPFTADSGKMLEYLFLLMMQHSGIPEWAWGGAISSSKASVEAQMPAFRNLIDYLRTKLDKAITTLCQIWLRTVSLYTRGITAEAKITLTWPEVVSDDRTITLEYLKYAEERGIITRQTWLEIAALPGVKNSEKEVEAAQEEKAGDREADRDPTDAALDDLFADNDKKVEDDTP